MIHIARTAPEYGEVLTLRGLRTLHRRPGGEWTGGRSVDFSGVFGPVHIGSLRPWPPPCLFHLFLAKLSVDDLFCCLVV